MANTNTAASSAPLSIPLSCFFGTLAGGTYVRIPHGLPQCGQYGLSMLIRLPHPLHSIITVSFKPSVGFVAAKSRSGRLQKTVRKPGMVHHVQRQESGDTNNQPYLILLATRVQGALAPERTIERGTFDPVESSTPFPEFRSEFIGCSPTIDRIIDTLSGALRANGSSGTDAR